MIRFLVEILIVAKVKKLDIKRPWVMMKRLERKSARPSIYVMMKEMILVGQMRFFIKNFLTCFAKVKNLELFIKRHCKYQQKHKINTLECNESRVKNSNLYRFTYLYDAQSI